MSTRTPVTHPWAVEVWSRSSSFHRSYMAGLQLFETEDQAKAYAADIEDSDDGDGWANVRKAKGDDREFA